MKGKDSVTRGFQKIVAKFQKGQPTPCKTMYTIPQYEIFCHKCIPQLQYASLKMTRVCGNLFVAVLLFRY